MDSRRENQYRGRIHPGIRTAVGSGNRRAPFHNIVVQGSAAAIGRWIADEFGQFFLNTFCYTHCEEMYMDGMDGMDGIDFLYSYYFIFLYQFYKSIKCIIL